MTSRCTWARSSSIGCGPAGVSPAGMVRTLRTSRSPRRPSRRICVRSKPSPSWRAAPKQRYTQENRLHLLPLPKEPETYKLPLEHSEIQALFDACDPTTTLGTRDLALLLVLLDGELRASEVTRL